MRRLGLLLGAAFFVAGCLIVGRWRLTRIVVKGHSMEPTLRDGDWLVVDRAPGNISVGDVVVAFDPRSPDRLIVKRVAEVGADSQLVLASDHPAHAEELIGPVARSAVLGKSVLRYWPPLRAGTPDGRALGKSVALRRQRQQRPIDE